MESIGRKITELRKKKGLNQREFAQQIGVSQPSLIKFEKGETDIIPLGVAVKIADVLGVPFADFFEIEAGMSSSSKLENEVTRLRSEVESLKKINEEKDSVIKDINIVRKSLVESLISEIETHTTSKTVYGLLRYGEKFITDKAGRELLKKQLAEVDGRRKKAYEYYLNLGLFTQKDIDEMCKKIYDSQYDTFKSMLTGEEREEFFKSYLKNLDKRSQPK